MNELKLAESILGLVGGKSNVVNLVHCMTRLRFNLTDESLADEEKIKKLKGVMGVAKNGGQFQVIIGNKVSLVYKELIQMLGNGSNNEEIEGVKKEKSSIISLVLDNIAGIFTPMIFAISAVGMLKGITALMLMLNLVSNESGIYKTLELISDSVFYFFPILLAFSTAKKIKTNEFGAVVVALVLLNPNLKLLISNLNSMISSFHLYITPINYSYSVLSIIIAIWFMSYVEKLINKVLPDLLKMLIGPMLTVLIVIFATILIIGPIGNLLDNGIIVAINTLFNKVGLITGLIIGGIFSLIIMTGMHYVVMLIAILSISKQGVDYLLPIMLMANIGQAGAAFGVFLKTKDKDMKNTASAAAISALIGITEPAMFGVNRKLKNPFIAAGIGGALGGSISGLFKGKAVGLASPSVVAFPIFAGDTFVYVMAVMLVSFIVSMAITFILGFKDIVEVNEEEVSVEIDKPLSGDLSSNEKIYSPITGNIKKLSEVNDVTFAEEMMGKGIAIEPSSGRIVSPINGVVGSIFSTKHAIGLVSDNGAEILIHIGLDTVKLEGKYFTAHVKEGDKIKVGDLIMEFDIDGISGEGFEIVTPVIITNTDSYSDINVVNKKEVKEKEVLLQLV